MDNELHSLTTEELGRLFPIILKDYNSDWPILYKKEKTLIKNIIPPEVLYQITHIGSTAIPGIKAKPTIDILIEVNKPFIKDEFIQSFVEVGYNYIPQPENPPPHIMLAKGYTPKGFKGQAFHIHVRYRGDWDEPVFRDYLIKHPEKAKEYEALKQELSKKHKNNRENYTNAKTDFINKVMHLARKS